MALKKSARKPDQAGADAAPKGVTSVPSAPRFLVIWVVSCAVTALLWFFGFALYVSLLGFVAIWCAACACRVPRPLVGSLPRRVAVTAYLTHSVKHPPWNRPGLGQTIVGSAKILWGPHTNDPLTDFGLPHDTVEIPVHEGSAAFTLRGWHVPAARPSKVCVLAVHGGGRDRRAFLRHTPCFHRAGYGTLLFDCREHGLSDSHGRGLGLGSSEAADVLAVVRALRRDLNYDYIVALGTSQVRDPTGGQPVRGWHL